MLSPILAVTDIDASIDFYVQKLGFSKNWALPNASGKTDFANVKFADMEILLGVLEGFVAPEDVDKRGIGVQIYIEVPPEIGINNIYNLAKTGSANITREIEDRDWGERAFSVKDIDGYHLLFAQRIKAKGV